MSHDPLLFICYRYPAGFVYVYSGLYYITDYGSDIKLAQWIFAGLYLANLTVILLIYLQINKTQRYPPYMLVFLGCTAYRIHSIFVLRLFNDPVAMFLLYLAVLLFINHSWTLGCAVYRYYTYMYIIWIIERVYLVSPKF